MTKKFTEEEYQKIVDCFDRINDDYNLGLMNDYLIREMQHELDSEFDLVEDWAEIIAISNPRTRQRAHEKFVEKENKYHWRYKKTDEDGDHWYLEKCSGLIVMGVGPNKNDMLTENEIIEAGYNPDMYDKEEVE